jgi:hypothetical protein
MAITSEIQTAIADLQHTFPDSAITVAETGDGGAWVRIEPVPIGSRFNQPTSWIVFQVPFTYPEADIYPLFVRADLTRADGQPLGEGYQPNVGCWTEGQQMAIQLSRRTNTFDALTSTAVGKVLKVLKWLDAG